MFGKPLVRSSRVRPLHAIVVGLLLSMSAAHLSDAQPVGIAPPALDLINELVQSPRSSFFVYRDRDSGFNNGFPSGWFAGGPALAKIHLNAGCVFDAASPSGCTGDQRRLDRLRGTVTSISWDPLAPGEFVGVNYEEPENYGSNPRGFGYDLRGATRVCFDTLSPTPPSANFKVQFGVGRKVTPFVSIPSVWTALCFDFAALGLTPAALADVHFPFTAVSNDQNAATGGTVLLDNIRFEPVPTAQRSVVSFPQASAVFGVVPAGDVLPGRVPIPPDQILANLTTTYESAMAVLTLLRAGDARSVANARRIADAFVYALGHDNQGLPIPAAPDGSRGLHNAMSSGRASLANDQGPGAGRVGQLRLAGFSIASNRCGSTRYCLVLDGATGGNNAFAVMALVESYQRFHDRRYLDAARMIGRWIDGTLRDRSGTGYGGYYLGYPDEGQPKTLLTGKSVENNADIFLAFLMLADAIRPVGLGTESDDWTQRARIAGDFVMAMFDAAAGRFFAGTVPAGTPASPGISPDGPHRGSDVINTYDFLDAQTFTTLPLASSSRYRNAIDWRRPVQWMLSRYAQTISSGGLTFQGFGLTSAPTSGPDGIAWEFTGQAIITMRFVDRLYSESQFEPTAQFYLTELRRAQLTSTFGDTRGLVAATLQGGESLAPYDQCLSTPFQCVAARVGLAATTWAILADLDQSPFTPLAAPNQLVDLTIDFGPGVGLWKLIDVGDTRQWQPLHPLSPHVLVSADVDGSGRIDLVMTFAGFGVWAYMNNATWERLHGLDATSIKAGDIDGNGRDDLAMDFPGQGLWIRYDSGRWGGLHAANVTSLALGNVDDDPDHMADVVVHLPGAGVWAFLNNSAWTLVHPAAAQNIQLGDLDGNGVQDLIVQFTGYGVWVRNNSSWALLHSLAPTAVATGNVDGDGAARADVVLVFPGLGVWAFMNGATWMQLHGLDASSLAITDIDGNGQADVLVSFPDLGLWALKNGTMWIPLHSFVPRTVVSGWMN